MFIRLLLIFSLIPLIELALLIKVGGMMGVLPTIVLVAGTGIIGVSLARYHGFQLLGEIKRNLQQGQLPADHLIEGLILLLGGAMLLTPGLLTDTTGFLLIIPGTRKIAARYAKQKFKHLLQKGRFNVSFGEYRQQNPPGQEPKEEPYIDVDYEDLQDR